MLDCPDRNSKSIHAVLLEIAHDIRSRDTLSYCGFGLVLVKALGLPDEPVPEDEGREV